MVEEALAEWATTFPVSEKIKTLIAQSVYDLNFGPPGNGYPGFKKATKLISEAFDTINDVWVEVDTGCVFPSQPEGWEEDGEWNEAPESYFVPRNQVLTYFMDKSLVPYI